PDRVPDVLTVGVAGGRGRQPLQHPFGTDQVADVVLDVPARAVGRRRPLLLRQRVADGADRAPDLLQLVDAVLGAHGAPLSAPLRAPASGSSPTAGRSGRA